MMPSARRLKAIAVLAVVAFVTIFFLSRSVSQSDETFLTSTIKALNRDSPADHGRGGTAAVQDTKLREAHKQIEEEVAAEAQDRRKKEKEDNEHAHEHVGLNAKEGVKVIPSKDASHGSQQVLMGGIDEDKAPDTKSKRPHEVGATNKGKWTDDDEVAETKDKAAEKTEQEHEVDAELTSILKRSPIIIFSKSYCPYSKKAKAVFAKYTITPAPFIVELDQHDLGSELQDKLLDTTGRRTVPNILISGKSIGGGDDIVALDQEGKLIETIKTMGGKRIMEAKLAR